MCEEDQGIYWVCPNDGEPVIETYRNPEAAFLCIPCGKRYPYDELLDAPSTPELDARYHELTVIYEMRRNNLDELTPDWEQIYLNGGPPCFAVTEGDHRFCNRSERWQGHPSDHKFVSWTDFLFEVMMWGQGLYRN